jgi:hypothetical protein
VNIVRNVAAVLIIIIAVSLLFTLVGFIAFALKVLFELVAFVALVALVWFWWSKR